MSEYIADSRRTARKVHKCYWCNRAIEVGESYSTTTFKEDYIYTIHECDVCAPFVAEMWENKDYGWNDDGGLRYVFRAFMYEMHPEVAEEWDKR